MAGKTAILKVKVIEDSKQAKTGLQGSAKAVSGFKDQAVKAGAALAGAFAATKIVSFAQDTVRAASDLNETMSKTQQVFGASAAGVLDWSKNSASALGQSQQSALDAASTFGILGKAAGLTGGDLTGFSTGLTQLASDMASFSNTTPDEAVAALGAGLRGEAEPLRKYGVLLDDATLRARALALGIITTTKTALTPQQRALAAQAEIMAQTKDQQGDFARTSDGLANSQRILAAQMQDTKASIGQAMLPAIQAVLPVLKAMMEVVQSLGPAFPILVAGIAAAVVVQWAWNSAMLAWPGTWIILGIAVLIAGIVLLWKKCAWFKAAIMTVWDALKTGFQWVVQNWPLLVGILFGPFGIAVALILMNWSKVTRLLSGVVAWVAGVMAGVAHAISAPFVAGFAAVRAAAETLIGWISAGFARLGGMVDTVIGGIKGVYNTFARVWNGIQVSMPTIDTKIPGIGKVGGFTLGLPDLPMMARGGYVTRATLGVFGEAGAEIAAPVPMLRQIIRQEAGGAVQITVNVPATANPAETGREVAGVLRAFFRAGGRLEVPA
jgi:hypothetical protein